MIQTWCCAFVALILLLVPARPAIARLPDDGLKRAQQAEKLLRAGKPDDAIKMMAQLDRDYPGEPAVSLRLGQIYDTLGQYGEALFYFRRYAGIAGSRTIPEAQMRL